MNSVMKHVVILKKEFPIENVRFIPAGAAGFIISKNHLVQSKFSPTDYNQLLHEADEAKAQGHLYIDFKDYGKCVSIPLLIL